MANQLHLFNNPTLNILMDVKARMSEAARDCGISRALLCDRMNEIAGRYGVHLIKGNGHTLAMSTLDKWLNPMDREHYPAINALEIFCAATNSVEPLRAMIEPLGGQIIGEKDAKLLAWAKHYHTIKGEQKMMKRIEADL